MYLILNTSETEDYFFSRIINIENNGILGSSGLNNSFQPSSRVVDYRTKENLQIVWLGGYNLALTTK